MESLSPISRHDFEHQIAKGEPSSKASASKKKVTTVSKGPTSIVDPSNSSSEEGDIESEKEETPSPFRCLFCSLDLATNDDGLATNLEHMRTVHSFLVPNLDSIFDMQSFIAYLATEIYTWNECLYCGAVKDSTLAIQSHMRDKGHCVLNLEREPELLDFWENSSKDDEGDLEDQQIQGDGTELILPSGKVIGSKNAATVARKAARKRGIASRALVLASESNPGSETSQNTGETASSQLTFAPQLSSSRQLSRREEMSMTGLSPQQRQALMSAEKKAQRNEAVALRAREWVNAKNSNAQEFDQLDNRAKFGKQNHKLLPR